MCAASMEAQLIHFLLFVCLFFWMQAKSVKEIGSVTPEGLVKGHAYAITATDKVRHIDSYIQYVCHIVFKILSYN